MFEPTPNAFKPSGFFDKDQPKADEKEEKEVEEDTLTDDGE